MTVLVPGNPRWESATDLEKMEYVRGVIEQWRPRLNLHGWRLHIQLRRDRASGDSANLVNAEIRVHASYMNACIDIYSPMWDSCVSDAEREHCLVHELVHALIDPMKRRFEAARHGEMVTDGEMIAVNERVTSLLTAIIWAAYDGATPETTEALGE